MNQVECGGALWNECKTDAVAQQSLACINDALATGARASYYDTALSSDWLELSIYMFTADHHVRVYNHYDRGDGHHDNPHTVEGVQRYSPHQITIDSESMTPN